MYKKHELIIGFIFWNNFFKKNLLKKPPKNPQKTAESSRSISPIKKNVKHSKMAGTTTTNTTFKSEWKK